MSTYHGLHYHITFSTKDRRPWLAKDFRDEVHRYLGGIVKGLDGMPRCIGGVEDHVHLLVSLTTNHRMSDFMRDLKKSASVWIKETFDLRSFCWQDGYFAITVSPSLRGEVHRYIENQEEHHRKRTYLEELRILLDRAGIEYDERFLE